MLVSRLDEHYESLGGRPGNGPVDFGLGSLPADRLSQRFVAVDGRETVVSASNRETLVAMGIGMTGPPHLGTVGQLYTAIELQEAGLDVQLVLADLEPYHGGETSLSAVRKRTRRYRQFALDLGFDPDQGWLRTQYGAEEVLQTAAVLAPYYDRDAIEPADSPTTEWEQAVEDAYEAVDTEAEEQTAEPERPTSETARRLSGLLHGADFLHPIAEQGYETVVIAMGADEHELVPYTRTLLDRAPIDGSIAGLYTRMITGLGDDPKMGRSLPGSALTLDDDLDRIRDRIRTAEPRESPTDSMVVEAIRLATPGGSFDPGRVETACRNGGPEWDAITTQYADLVADLADHWQSYDRKSSDSASSA